MLPVFLATCLAQPNQPIQIDFRSRSGFFASLAGIEISQGSFAQYYAPGWTRGYYSTNWNEQVVTPVEGGLDVTFRSADGRVDARIEYRRTNTGLKAEYSLGWNSDEPANVEVSLAHLWAPALESGTILVDGIEARSPSVRAQRSASAKQRQFGAAGTQFIFDAPLARIEAKVTGTQAYVFDARNYDQDFARGRELFWFGLSDLATKRGQPAKFSVEWTIVPKRVEPGQRVRVVSGIARPQPQAHGSFEGRLPLVPLPKSVSAGSGASFVWPDFSRVRLGREWEPILGHLNARFDLSIYSPRRAGQIELGIKNLDLPAGGYTLEASEKSLVIYGQDREGLRNGMHRAVNLLISESGELRIAPTKIRDYPSIGWRGLHLFVGPEALRFQGDFMARVLSPMMFNQIVLQCERTDWISAPGTKLGWTMSRADLKALFDLYRQHGIEPTPLIQSFGHMGWLFANGQNKDIAFNPEVLFSVDPRKGRTREQLAAIWKEAIALLNPKILHFGLDEVDMRGWPNDPKLVTELWNLHVKWLGEFAKEQGREMMIWGDQLLAPGEAPDAMNGHNAAEAKSRRDALPRGTYVADWHYINNADPSIYRSLQIFQREGLRPVASTWNRPENIKGFFKAAEQFGAGVLQTTWAGYESNERNMLTESSQYTSYVLAAEYAWSGRPELAMDLPYRPEDLLRRLMYAGSVPVRPVQGQTVSWGGASSATRIGNFAVRPQSPLPLWYPLSQEGADAPGSLEVTTPGLKGRSLVVGLSVQSPLAESAPVVRVEVSLASGEKKALDVRYGQHVRAPRDLRRPLTAPQSGGMSAVEVRLQDVGTAIRSVRLLDPNPSAGVRLHAITAY